MCIRDSRHPSLRPTIELWDLQLAKIGTILTSFRMDYLKKLGVFAGRIYEGLSQGKEEVQYQYRSTVFPEEIEGYTDASIEQYYQALCAAVEEDSKTGFTSVGVHRDEMCIRDRNCAIRAEDFCCFIPSGYSRILVKMVNRIMAKP